LCAGEDMQQVLVIFHVMEGSTHIQARHGLQIFKVVFERGLRRVICKRALLQVAFKFGEERRFIGAQRRIKPVFREQEDFPVGLPDSILAHPLPLQPILIGYGVHHDTGFQV
jgi:hypothetical protein